MGNLFDWLAWRGDITLSQLPFGEVDNLALSVLAYLPLDGIVPGLDEKRGICLRDAAEAFFKNANLQDSVRDEQDKDFLRALAASERFGPLELFAASSLLDNETETQFAALTVDTGDRHLFVAFRGTDMSLTGWKEDFNMSFMDTVPAQLEAVKYLDRVARLRRGRLRVGGHSKGGNLAAFAAAFTTPRVQRRIVAVWNNDGPGFNANIVAERGYAIIKDRLYSFIPQSSVVGMLLEHEEAVTVIRSSRTGILQHDPYSWIVEGGHFARAEELDSSSLFIDRTLKDWLASMPAEKRGAVIEALYEIILSTESRTVLELASNWVRNAGTIIHRFNTIDSETRTMILEAAGLLFKAARKNMPLAFKDRNSPE